MQFKNERRNSSSGSSFRSCVCDYLFCRGSRR
nr:MAG TPA: hypothetical protein [Caudoviricetes sp.]